MTDDELARWVKSVTSDAKRHKRAQSHADACRDVLLNTVREAHARGASEYALAEAAGVQRSTVRAWLGK